ncbi:hypothetical protein BMW26_14420 [Microbacterium sp. 1.5R]|nr:hypothetical protein BMW26_14420 [Microbacterium sp. 1.5R]
MGLVALYVAMGAFGGTLKVDLSVAALFFVALVLFVALPLLVSTVSLSAAAVMLIIAVGVCGILPALGRRYNSVRLGIGLITVYAYGYHATQGINSVDIILGTFIAFFIVFVIRLIAAVLDRDAPLRNAVARVLTDPSRGALEDAAFAWLAGPSTVWTGESLIGAVQYRAAMWALVEQSDASSPDTTHSRARFIAEAAPVASMLADTIRSRKDLAARIADVRARLNELDQHVDLEGIDRGTAEVAVAGLRRSANASLARDGSSVRAAGQIRRRAARASVRAALSFRSDYLRQALRAMIAVALALLIVTFAGHPVFALPILMGAYGVLQPTFVGGLAEAGRRIIGVVVGAAVATLIVLTAPPAIATAISILALIIAFAFIASSIAIFMGSLVVTLTIAVAPLVHVDSVTYAIGYAIAVLVGALLAATVGFLSVPHRTLKTRGKALTEALNATADVLDAVGRPPASDIQERLLEAFRTQQNTAAAAPPAVWHADDEASQAVTGLNLLALAMVLGFAPHSRTAENTARSVTPLLRDGARQPLRAAAAESLSDDALNQLLTAEYGRLHHAVLARADRSR